MSGPYRYEARVIRTDEDLLALEPEWRHLYEAAPVRNPFLSFDWTAACRAHLAPGSHPFVVVALESGRLAGAAPLRIARQGPFRVLRFIGDGRSDYQGFLRAADHPEVEAVLMAELAASAGEWDLAVLRQLEDEHTGLNRAVLPKGMAGAGVHGTISPYLRIGDDWKEFCKTGPSPVRRAIRAEKKLRKEGGTVERITGDAIAGRIGEVAEIEARSWKARDGVTRFQPGPGQELLRQATASLGPRGEMELWLARVQDRPVAFLLNFLTPEKVWYYQGAYDEAYRKLYPGGVLHYLCIERLWQAGLREYDLLSGDEAYKFDWTNEARELRYRALFPANARGYLAYGLLLAPRWRLKNIEWVRTAHRTWVTLRNHPAGLLPARVAERPAACREAAGA